MVSSNLNLVTDIRSNQLSNELTDDEVKLITMFSEEIYVEKGQYVIKEGKYNQAFYLVKTGSLNVLLEETVTKQPITIREAGDFVGVLKSTDSPINSVIAREPSTLVRINVDKIFSTNRYQPLQIKLLSKLVKQLTTDVRINQNQMKNYYALGTLTIFLLCILSIYTLSLGALQGFVTDFGVSTYVDIGLIICFAWIMYKLIKKSHYPLKTFGVTMDNWKANLKEATILTSPILLFFLFLKWALITFIPAFTEIPLFNPTAALADIGFSFGMFTVLVVVYIVFSIVQEFIARAGLQSALCLYLPDSKGKLATAIILSNLLFAMAHSHIGTLFALVAFVPGIYWGWLFARQNSLIGVCFSHMLIGIWVLFILGFTQFIG
ncbi:CPBP family glutamic-type intramembrane protease [Alkalihalobacillus deserti]|uniref:CPBP family glutamic-type intramembrane protease n=1 Tax=Alkalihalobacillus deserti TaxID=2879466 RepID=UPI001D148BAB|nr:CPBP family glutamic-type intramembrane protease [Alkalihalobacillus deserti]